MLAASRHMGRFSSLVAQLDNMVVTATCEVYDGTTNEWQFIESLNAPCCLGSMVCLKGSLYVVEGLPSSSLSLVAECYDFEEKVWKEKTKLPPSRTSLVRWYTNDY